MPIRIIQLGSARQRDEGVRIGTVRRPPRGVPKKDHAKLDFYDAWLPELAPSAALLRKIKASPDTPKTWRKFMLQYAREMEQAPAVRIIDLLSLLSRRASFSVGCYCENENHCHRSTLREILKNHGAVIEDSMTKTGSL
jgi:uncharacterized protein YeaO (DUF488 family)